VINLPAFLAALHPPEEPAPEPEADTLVLLVSDLPESAAIATELRALAPRLAVTRVPSVDLPDAARVAREEGVRVLLVDAPMLASARRLPAFLPDDSRFARMAEVVAEMGRGLEPEPLPDLPPPLWTEGSGKPNRQQRRASSGRVGRRDYQRNRHQSF
jgi:hypothetical protein